MISPSRHLRASNTSSHVCFETGNLFWNMIHLGIEPSIRCNYEPIKLKHQVSTYELDRCPCNHRFQHIEVAYVPISTLSH